jgi:polysaccharide export outer membrane protein
MHATTPTQRWLRILLSTVCALGPGCTHKQFVANPPIPDASVPRELSKVVLPPYVIEPPDVLLVTVLIPPKSLPVAHYKAETLMRPDERVPTDPKELEKFDQDRARSPVSRPMVPQSIDGQHLVRPDGTINLGIYGSVMVAGLTCDQARERVRAFISQITGDRPEELQVVVDVIAYNSKSYYVITDGAGNGEQVYAFPITGSETVLDAIGRINGLPPVSSKRHIWVARRSPQGGPDQILPVDWVSLTQCGAAATNYQVLPGDRVYVMSQPLLQADNWLAKVLSPVERVFGITLLGATTVQTLQGRTFGGNNP